MLTSAVSAFILYLGMCVILNCYFNKNNCEITPLHNYFLYAKHSGYQQTSNISTWIEEISTCITIKYNVPLTAEPECDAGEEYQACATSCVRTCEDKSNQDKIVCDYKCVRLVAFHLYWLLIEVKFHVYWLLIIERNHDLFTVVF